jgi:uncharacterized protein (TIGR03118 family)
MHRVWNFVTALICAGMLAAPSAYSQTNSFKQTNLVSDTPGMASHTDPNLVNPWGVALIPGAPFWVSNNNSGTSTLYDRNGLPQGAFAVPRPAGSSNPSTPTGIVANVINGIVAGFKVQQLPSQFIFATEDGTISGWNGQGSSAILALDNSPTGAVYKGLALVENDSGDFILATNFNSGQVESYSASFQPVALFGTPFTDPNLPAGYVPFGIHIITNNQVIVTYAQQDALKHDPIHAPGAGFVSLFDANGGFIRRVASQGTLNAPWGAAIAPSTFGTFAGALLIGNFGDGTINAFNLSSGMFLGQLKDSTGAAIANPSLWELLFDPSGTTGDPNTLYITAGLANEMHGLFAAITPNATPAPTADFSINASPTAMTIGAGQTASFAVTLGGLNGFNSTVTLACSGEPANSSCSFAPLTVMPASGGTAMSTLKISTLSSPYMPAGMMAKNRSGGTYAMLLLIPALALLGLLLFGASRIKLPSGNNWNYRFACCLSILLVSACLLAASGCGYKGAAASNGTQRGTTTVLITGSSNGLSHSASVTLTVQ